MLSAREVLEARQELHEGSDVPLRCRHDDADEASTGSVVSRAMGSFPKPLTTTRFSYRSGCPGSLTGTSPEPIWTFVSRPCESNAQWCLWATGHCETSHLESRVPRHDSSRCGLILTTKSSPLARNQS